MALVLKDIILPVTADESSLQQVAARTLGIRETDLVSLRVVRTSIDARKKNDIRINYTLRVELERASEAQLLNKCRAHVETEEDEASDAPVFGSKALNAPIVVAGFGPAGLFAAYTLAKYGYAPVVVERGTPMAERKAKVDTFFSSGVLDENSNVMFGEGGAGTFSDGKLTTRIKDPRSSLVLRTLFECGAPHDILIAAKPHIGTDLLSATVENMRNAIIEMGGKVLFSTKLCGFVNKDGAVHGVKLSDGKTEYSLDCSACVLAIGQGARDTYEMLCADGFELRPKPFAVGVRIEHPREMIDVSQFAGFAGHPRLGAAEYRLTGKSHERGVYTFCMCPGGVVVASSSGSEQVVTNGMSCRARNGENSNAAIVVQVDERDFGSGALDGMRFQQRLEKSAFELGGRDYRAPASRTEDFLAGRRSKRFGDVSPTYMPGVKAEDLRLCLPEFIYNGVADGIVQFARKLKGFDLPDAVITAVESRTSSPVRIVRTETGEASRMSGVYPVGEGAGYAGGIVSAAVDGMRAAERIMSQYARP